MTIGLLPLLVIGARKEITAACLKLGFVLGIEIESGRKRSRDAGRTGARTKSAEPTTATRSDHGHSTTAAKSTTATTAATSTEAAAATATTTKATETTHRTDDVRKGETLLIDVVGIEKNREPIVAIEHIGTHISFITSLIAVCGQGPSKYTLILVLFQFDIDGLAATTIVYAREPGLLAHIIEHLNTLHHLCG